MDRTHVALRPATSEEVERILVHALKFDGRRGFQSARDLMAEITAAHLAKALNTGLFVVMKAPPPLPGPPFPTASQSDRD